MRKKEHANKFESAHMDSSNILRSVSKQISDYALKGGKADSRGKLAKYNYAMVVPRIVAGICSLIVLYGRNKLLVSF